MLQFKQQQRASGDRVLMLEIKAFLATHSRVVGVEQACPELALRHRRQAEIDLIVMGVDHQQQRGVGPGTTNPGFLGAAIHQHAQAAALAVFPLLGGHFVAIRREPGDVLHADVFVVVAHQETPAPQDRVRQAQLDQALDELEQGLAVIVQVPVDPADLAVLAIGIVVAVLSASELVPGDDH